jgi:hypothetical protein
MLAVLDLDPVPETAAAIQTFAMLGDQSLQPEQAGMAEQVGADLALFEIAQEDAVNPSRQEPREADFSLAECRVAELGCRRNLQTGERTWRQVL